MRGSRGKIRSGSGHRNDASSGRHKGPRLPSSLMSEVGETDGAFVFCTIAELTRIGTARSHHGANRKGFELHPRGSRGNSSARGAKYRPQTQNERTKYEGESDSGPSNHRAQTRVGPPPSKINKRAAPETKDANPKKRKLPQLTLPGAQEESRDDAEIEWLEYMLKREKKKEEEDETLEDGLDGERTTLKKRGRELKWNQRSTGSCGYHWSRRWGHQAGQWDTSRWRRGGRGNGTRLGRLGR